LVIRSAAEWVAFWSVPGRLSSPVPNLGQPADPTIHVPAPDGDFEHFTLLAVVGLKPTGGYAVSISSIREQDAGVLVSVLDVGPGAGCAVTSIVTYPSVYALIPKTDEPVRFQISQVKTDCNIRPRIIDGETL
jgi:PrcB C-terminal